MCDTHFQSIIDNIYYFGRNFCSLFFDQCSDISTTNIRLFGLLDNSTVMPSENITRWRELNMLDNLSPPQSWYLLVLT